MRLPRPRTTSLTSPDRPRPPLLSGRSPLLDLPPSIDETYPVSPKSTNRPLAQFEGLLDLVGFGFGFRRRSSHGPVCAQGEFG